PMDLIPLYCLGQPSVGKLVTRGAQCPWAYGPGCHTRRLCFRCTPGDGPDAADARDADLAGRRGFGEIYLGHVDPSASVRLIHLIVQGSNGLGSKDHGIEISRLAKTTCRFVRKLAKSQELLDDSESQLRNAMTQVRQMETELLELTRAKDALRADLPRQAIEDYKKSLGFETGLVRMGRVSLEYEYQLALARLQARYLGLEIEVDSFTLLPEDANVPMADEQPFDDLPPIIKE
ncbi:hypothetical protein BHM03_00041313, partial [Ensete ventricosum]